MIEVENLSKKYNSSSREICATRNISVTFEDEGMIFILGKSGSGKTTFLNLLAGLDCATQGAVKYEFLSDEDEKKDIMKLTDEELDKFHNIYMGIVFQNNCLIENWSVRDNVLIAIQQQEPENGTAGMNERLDEILEYVDLKGYQDRKVAELSGGQAQRVAIARALIKKPEVIFADEPTGNLDEKSSRCAFELLKKVSEECLVVIVSHDERAAYEYGDRIIKLADGEIVDDIVINSTDIEYSLSIKECNEGVEAFETARNVERIKDFLLKNIISEKNKQFYIDYKVKKLDKKMMQEKKSIVK